MTATSANLIASPCMRLCMLDRDTGLCRGCFRTIREIGGWTSMSEAERQQVWDALPARRVAAKAEKAISPEG